MKSASSVQASAYSVPVSVSARMFIPITDEMCARPFPIWPSLISWVEICNYCNSYGMAL